MKQAINIVLALVLFTGLYSCKTVRKMHDKTVTHKDSTAHQESQTLTITTEKSKIDTTVFTDSSTVEGSFDFWLDSSGADGDNYQSIETEDLRISVKPNVKTGKITVKATAKPKAITVHTETEKTTVTDNKTQAAVITHEGAKGNHSGKEKKPATNALIISAVMFLVILVIVLWWLFGIPKREKSD